MNNSHSRGDHITYVAPANIVSGQALALGVLLVVSITDVASGASGAGAVEGVFALPKLASAEVAQGDSLIWDVSEGEFIVASAAAGDLVGCAVAVAAAGAGAETVLAKLALGAATIQSGG